MSPTTIWTKAIFFGKRVCDNTNIYLSAPSWNCDCYWGFGYLGNSREHYHLDNYQQPPNEWNTARNINMYEALLKDYELNPRIKNNLWTFCELVKTVYTLREAAEVYHRGGSNYTKNPCAELIKNPEEYRRINWEVLPKMFDTIYNLIGDFYA